MMQWSHPGPVPWRTPMLPLDSTRTHEVFRGQKPAGTIPPWTGRAPGPPFRKISPATLRNRIHATLELRLPAPP